MRRTQAELPFRTFFPDAIRYATPPWGGNVREGGRGGRVFPYSERHVQAVWFDPVLRPQVLRTVDGEAVFVEDAGMWNLEAGPDFLGAAVRLGPDQRRVTGDVEIHVHAGDWRAHDHAADRRYANVRFHVTYFPGRLPAGALPSGAVQISLKDALAGRSEFSFEGIDVTAYPYAARAAVPPCLEILRGWSRDAKEAMLDAAGQERLRRKTERFAAALAEKGAGQALYEECMAVLGYRHNKNAFRQLAEALPHDELRADAAGDPDAAYAILAGVAGLLPDDMKPAWDEETRRFVRSLWDAWWRRRERYRSRVFPRDAWNLASLRPLNHPLRRLVAAALLVTRRTPLAEGWSALAGASPATTVDALAGDVGSLRHAYWSRRSSLGGAVSERDIALVGGDRADAMVLNAAVPFLAATDRIEPFEAGFLARLPAEQENVVIRQAAHNLLGRDHAPAIYKTGLRRQGLIQVFHDYCLSDRSRCASCTFPALLRHHMESR